MINTELNLSINEPEWEQLLPDIFQTAEKVVSQTVSFIASCEPLVFFDSEKTLSFNLCLSDDHEVHTLNKEFRHIDKPTNVLSFANIDDPDFDQISQQQTIEMGDIIIALQTLQNEADIKHISLHDHFCHLLTHGVLHLLGYDHTTDEEAEHMEDLEAKILNLFNIDNPYKE